MSSGCRTQTCRMRSVAVVLCLLVAGCGNASAPESTPQRQPGVSAERVISTHSNIAGVGIASWGSSSASAKPSSSEKPAGTMIMAAESDFGTILYDATGQPIYLFDAETSSRPKCYDECAKAWPPVLTSGAPRAKGAVQSDLLGTTPRTDGATQIT